MVPRYSSLVELRKMSEMVLPDGLSSSDIQRYSRQILVNDFGVAGQAAIRRSTALVVGAGGNFNHQ